MITDEEKVYGKVTLGDYNNLAKYSLGWASYPVYFLVAIVPPVVQLCISYWIAKWTSMSLEDQQKPINFWIYVYFSLGYCLT